MKRIILLGVTALLLVVAAVLYFALPQSRDVESQGEANETVSRKLIPSKKIGKRAKKVVGRKLLGKRTKSSDRLSAQEPEENWSPAEKKLAEELQKALDEEDFAATQRLSVEAAKSENLQIVSRAIEALKWFGPKALPELTALAAKCSEIADRARQRAKSAGRSASLSSNSGGAGGGVADGAEGGGADGGETAGEDLIEAAEEALQMSMGAIEEKLGEIDDDAEKARFVSQYMKATSDEDMLTMLEGHLNSVSDEKLVLTAAIDVIENGAPVAVEHAKEVYEFQTGESYTGRQAAEAWLQENYTPSE